MTDEKQVFIEDVKEKGLVARSARNRIGKAQPSEHWRTLRKKNGEIMEYRIGQPISWTEFVSYPPEMQQKWIDVFIEKFDCGGTGMMLAFSSTRSQLISLCHRRNLSINTRKQLTPEKEKRIRAWMAQGCTAVEAVSEIAPVVVQPKPEKREPVAQPYFVNVLRNGHMELSGTASEIFQTLFGIFRDARLELSVSFTVLPEEPVIEEIVEEDVAEEPEQEVVETEGRVNLNTCTFRDLRDIGMSANVAATVMQRKPFTRVEDLLQVPGINKAFYNVLVNKVTV